MHLHREQYNLQNIERKFSEEFGYRISGIINCVGMLGLDNCYLNQHEAYEVNGLIPKVLHGVLHFSTESVFHCPLTHQNQLQFMEKCLW